MTKEKPNRNKARELTTEEVEAALHAALRNEGHLFPQTDEDVAELERNLDLSSVPTPDTDKFRRLLEEHAGNKVISLPQMNQATSPVVEENLAQAARNGRKIPDEVQRRMDRLRAEHEIKRSGKIRRP
jgi:hypothetical protein